MLAEAARNEAWTSITLALPLSNIRKVTVEHVFSVKKYYKTAADSRCFVWLSRASRRSLTIGRNFEVARAARAPVCLGLGAGFGAGVSGCVCVSFIQF